jgi:hypothetical protein
MLEGINWLAVLVAAVAGYLLGAIWYTPAVFGNRWMAALEKKPEELGSPVLALTVSALTTALTGVCLAFLLRGLGIQTLGAGVVCGIVIGGGIVFASMLSDYLFQSRSMTLLWIQGGYRLLYVVLICAIIAGWP